MAAFAELDGVRQRLAPYASLSTAFDSLVSHLLACPGVQHISPEGSLATGALDEFSDLDLAVVVEPPLDGAALRTLGASVGPLLAYFPATHLGLPHLHIFFVEVIGEVVKIDIKLVQQSALSDGTASDVDVELAHQRFTGWTWYTYTKLARGEILEALSSLDVMRERAVLPVLQIVRGLPREGYRHLERRLHSHDLSDLLDTYPHRVDRSETLRALAALVRMFRSLAPTELSGLDVIVARIARAEPGFTTEAAWP